MFVNLTDCLYCICIFCLSPPPPKRSEHINCDLLQIKLRALILFMVHTSYLVSVHFYLCFSFILFTAVLSALTPYLFFHLHSLRYGFLNQSQRSERQYAAAFNLRYLSAVALHFNTYLALLVRRQISL